MRYRSIQLFEPVLYSAGTISDRGRYLITRSRHPPNIRHKLRNNTLSIPILVLFDYMMYYDSMVFTLCPPDNYPQSNTLRKPTLILAHDEAVDAPYLSVLYCIYLELYGYHIITDCSLDHYAISLQVWCRLS